MRIHTLRITPGKDLKQAIEAYVTECNIHAGFIVTCVGGLQKATLRSADISPGKPSKQALLHFSGPNDNNFEITSLTGTVSVNGVHLHMSIADKEGTVYGGHLKEGALIYPTAEVVIGEDTESVYARELDMHTGYAELVVRKQ